MLYEVITDFSRVRESERTARDGEILCENADREARDFSGSGDDPVGRQLLLIHVEVAAFVRNNFV